MLACAILLAQSNHKVMFRVPAPRGIYRPDFSTCSQRDRGIYAASLPGYLHIGKSEFGLSILNGTWSKKGHKLYLRTTMFMDREIGNDSDKQSFDTFFQGLVFSISSNGDLILHPGKGQHQTSTLRFRRLKAIPLIKVLDIIHERDFDAKVINSDLGWAYFFQLYDSMRDYESQLFSILKSNSKQGIRTEAATYLEGTKRTDAVEYSGKTLLATPQNKDRELAFFRRRLINILTASQLPISFEYGKKAFASGKVGVIDAGHIAGNSGHQGAAAFIENLATKNPSSAQYLIRNTARLDAKSAVKFAKKYEESPDLETKVSALAILATREASPEERDQAVAALYNLFDDAGWLRQCDIAQAFGDAQTPFAYERLTRLATKATDEVVGKWIKDSLSKYAKK